MQACAGCAGRVNKLRQTLLLLLFAMIEALSIPSLLDGFKLKSLILAQNERWRQA